MQEENNVVALPPSQLMLHPKTVKPLARLSKWFPRGQSLQGVVHGHPHLQDGEVIVTSAILSMDPDKAWAETQNTFYLLSNEFKDGSDDFLPCA